MTVWTSDQQSRFILIQTLLQKMLVAGLQIVPSTNFECGKFQHNLRINVGVQCHHQLAPDLCSEFSSDLRAHCSATIVSRLLRNFHNFGFCGFLK